MVLALCNVGRRAGYAFGQAPHVKCHKRIDQGGRFGSRNGIRYRRWEVTVFEEHGQWEVAVFEELFALTDVGRGGCRETWLSREVVVGRRGCRKGGCWRGGCRRCGSRESSCPPDPKSYIKREPVIAKLPVWFSPLILGKASRPAHDKALRC